MTISSLAKNIVGVNRMVVENVEIESLDAHSHHHEHDREHSHHHHAMTVTA